MGDRTYKLLKPVRTDFLDHGTSARRRAAARAEVRLNRRMAPDVYLGIAEVGSGPEREPLIVMRRLPADRRLAERVRQAGGQECLRAVAKAVAALHAAGPSTPEVRRAGAPDAVRALWSENAEETRALAAHGRLDADEVERVGAEGLRYLRGRGPLLVARVEEGFIRDGHGDLQADDIFCLDDGPRILDCLAFDDGLRHGDVLADAGFLAMDLERLGHPDAAEAFMARYRQFSFEHHPRSLEHFYVAYRALVRTKVALLRAAQGAPEAAELAHRYLSTAGRRIRRARMRLVLVGGPPGVGKSTIALGLSDATGAALLRSDEVRKDMAGLGHGARDADPFATGLYRPEATDAVYEEIVARAEYLLGRGEHVVLDASWGTEGRRERAREAARRCHAEIVELRADCPPEVAAQRVAARTAAGGDASDADPAVAARLRADFAPWPSAETIDTRAAPEAAVARAAEVVGPT